MKINKVMIEWVFGMGFDDHEDNYVTLFNKNFSQKILSKFDQTEDENDAEYIDTSSNAKRQAFIPNPSSRKKAHGQYEKLELEILGIDLQQIELQGEAGGEKSLGLMSSLVSVSYTKQNYLSILFQISDEHGREALEIYMDEESTMCTISEAELLVS